MTHPIEASCNGRTNAYTHTCVALNQSMSYAACLHRIEAVQSGSFPSDWSPCAKAGQIGGCEAEKMRREEIAKGQAIYFIQRGAIQQVTDKAREWISSWNKSAKPAKRGTEPKSRPTPARSSGSVLDAIGDASAMGYADAINAASATPPVAAAPAEPSSVPPRGQMVKVLPGETPLQAARRLAAERANKS